MSEVIWAFLASREHRTLGSLVEYVILLKNIRCIFVLKSNNYQKKVPEFDIKMHVIVYLSYM